MTKLINGRVDPAMSMVCVFECAWMQSRVQEGDSWRELEEKEAGFVNIE